MASRVAPRQEPKPDNWPKAWPAEHTIDLLYLKHPKLLLQCALVFGRMRAGQVVFNINKERPQADGKEWR